MYGCAVSERARYTVTDRALIAVCYGDATGQDSVGAEAILIEVNGCSSRDDTLVCEPFIGRC